MDDIKSPSLLKKLLKLTTTHIKTLSITLLGILSAAAIPIWQIYYVDIPDVSIEISGINRVNSDFFQVSLDTDELLLLEPYIDQQLLYEFSQQGIKGDKIDYPTFSLADLQTAYEKAKQDLKNISITKSNLQKNIKTIDALLDPTNNNNQLAEFRISELKSWDLSNYIDDTEAQYYESQVLALTRNYSEMTYAKDLQPVINLSALSALLIDVKEDIHDVINDSNERLESLRNNIRSIESQLNKLAEMQEAKYTWFQVEVIASNAGRSSTSLRPIALMRVQINKENYVDVKLEMDKFQQSSQLSPSSTKIIRYRSAELNRFPGEDQLLLNKFWGTSGKAKLFTIDTQHNIYRSNQIPFIDNLNQRVITDKLKEAANSAN